VAEVIKMDMQERRDYATHMKPTIRRSTPYPYFLQILQIIAKKVPFLLHSRAAWVSTPPALRPAREVLRLSAIDGAGNACVLPLA
jgi:hypothetical protein